MQTATVCVCHTECCSSSVAVFSDDCGIKMKEEVPHCVTCEHLVLALLAVIPVTEGLQWMVTDFSGWSQQDCYQWLNSGRSLDSGSLQSSA